MMNQNSSQLAFFSFLQAKVNSNIKYIQFTETRTTPFDLSKNKKAPVLSLMLEARHCVRLRMLVI